MREAKQFKEKELDLEIHGEQKENARDFFQVDSSIQNKGWGMHAWAAKQNA